MKFDIRLILPILFVVDSINALNAIRLNNRKYYATTKPLLMPLLLASYLVFLPKELLLQPYQKYVIITLILHTQGDILLLFPKNKTKIYLYLGALSFFIGNIFNILWFSQPCWNHDTLVFSVAAVFALTVEILFSRMIISANKKQGIALAVYSTAVASLFVVAASTKSVVATLGAVIFWISDYSIAKREQGLKTRSDEFTLGTYLIGQVLILTGMYLLQI